MAAIKRSPKSAKRKKARVIKKKKITAARTKYNQAQPSREDELRRHDNTLSPDKESTISNNSTTSKDIAKHKKKQTIAKARESFSRDKAKASGVKVLPKSMKPTIKAANKKAKETAKIKTKYRRKNAGSGFSCASATGSCRTGVATGQKKANKSAMKRVKPVKIKAKYK
jgi:hypothetical protein